MWRYRVLLMGTAGSWFILDILFYGNGLFASDVSQRSFALGQGGPGWEGSPRFSREGRSVLPVVSSGLRSGRPVGEGSVVLRAAGRSSSRQVTEALGGGNSLQDKVSDDDTNL
jgi:hypothetical protein